MLLSSMLCYYLYVIFMLVFYSCLCSCCYFKCLCYPCLLVFYYVNTCIVVLHLYLIVITNLFCLSNQQKIAKRKFDTNPICCLITYFGMNKAIFVFMVFTSMHVLNFMFEYVWYEIGIVAWLGIIILRSLKKGVPWKFWLDPRFLQNPKVDFKVTASR